jgi:NAD(P)-dependent dehydrogenase (short-subunit alcohol dehydrogenase family)
MKLASQPQAPQGLNLSGQTGIITGASSGIGYAAANSLLTYNLSHLIITVRTESKGTEAAAKLRKLHPRAKIEVWMLDLLSYESIQSFATRCRDELERIDFVILSAAVGYPKFEKDAHTGHEATFQVNYLSTVLLCLLFLPVLRNKRPRLQGEGSKPGRITIIGSGMALTSKLVEADGQTTETGSGSGLNLFAALDDARYFDFLGRYATTKLLLCMFLRKLAERISPNDVVVNIVDPALVKTTGKERSGSWVFRIQFGILRTVIGRSLSAGAWTYVDAAVIKGRESHGSWICNFKVYP